MKSSLTEVKALALDALASTPQSLAAVRQAKIF